MIEDLRTAPDGQTLEGDVCIVGAGPAGVALAEALAGSGLEIILLESGGMAVERSVQVLNVSENVGLQHGGATEGRARTFGGAGRVWAGQCLRLDAVDFESRSWVPLSGWPIAQQTLEPFYEDAERYFRVDGQPTDSSAYRLFGRKLPAWAPDTIESMFTVYTPEVDVGRFHRMSLKRARNVRVVLHATVIHIDTEDARATGLRLCTFDGRISHARAQAYVLCAGGIENARLLLASDEQRSSGLGNSCDLVGRYFQEHPNGVTATIDCGDPMAMQALFRIQYNSRRYFPKFRLSEAAQRVGQVLNANAHLTFEEAPGSGMAALRIFVAAARQRKLPAHAFRQSLALLLDARVIGRAALARARGGAVASVPNAVRLQCYLEQSPNPDSRIRLSRRKDMLGMRQAAIDWRLGELERRTAAVMTQQVAAEFARLGLGRVRPDVWLGEPGDGWQSQLVDSYHHAGTTRMAAFPTQGVVDPTLEVFDVAGLYVCGGSVFPTSGYANPTLTIVALALRLAQQLRRKLSTAK